MLRSACALACVLTFGSTAFAQTTEFGEWKSLFNGKDVSGWIAAKPHEGAANQKQNVWKVDGGALTNGGRGKNDLCTKEEFGDYELEVEYRIGPGGNSGVYLRGQIEIQIFDSAAKSADELKSVDAGAIYGGNFVAKRQAQKPAGQWNKYRILHVGHRITVWHNNVLIQDNVWAPNKTGGAMNESPIDRHKLETDRGPLMFQGDHEEVWYRNIRIRPLFTKDSKWRSIWNGEDLSAFTARGKNARLNEAWRVKDDAFYNEAYYGKKGGHGFDIWTKESYGNFLVYYCYKSVLGMPGDQGGNSGFYLRDQWEIQIYGKSSTTNKHADGSLYSLYTPLQLARNAPDEWNHMFVKVENMKIWVWQNGKLIHDGRICTTRTDNHGVPTTRFSRAPFKIQGDHGRVMFSQLWIKELPDTRQAD